MTWQHRQCGTSATRRHSVYKVRKLGPAVILKLEDEDAEVGRQRK